mmetsp:Transcript_118145/g.229684  ORF Transcript_118145/g.229684 Transcript_118145/m.229684 type:complete len:540 (+) Transcript_118145:51-1670(+)
MCRLATLLSRFQLPPVATTAELKRAYLRDAKRLHPDCNPRADRDSAAQAFVRLKADFEEALGLLERSGNAADRQAEFSSGWPQQSRSTRWSSAAWAADSTARHMEAEARASRYTNGVPTVGLSPKVVYPAAAALSVSVFFALFLQSDNTNDAEPTGASRRGFRLRHVLEQDDNSHGAPNHEDVSSDAHMLADLDRSLVDEQVDSAAHIAAGIGRVWWIERCGASPSCRVQLELGNENGDTPLHFCARGGKKLACQTLLRLGVDPVKRNRWGLTPEHLAHYSGHGETASLIRGVRQGTFDECRAAGRHPDGLGLSTRQKWDVAGMRSSESLRHATNLAAGCSVVGRSSLSAAASTAGALSPSEPALPPAAPSDCIATAQPSRLSDAVRTAGPHNAKEVEAALARLRSVLHAKGYTLIGPVPVNLQQSKGSPAEREEQVKRLWTRNKDDMEVCGLLMYEAPGSVTADAPGHWVAVRHEVQTLDVKAHFGHVEKSKSGALVSKADFVRLDPVRGPFRMTSVEMANLLSRYCVWQLLREAAEL